MHRLHVQLARLGSCKKRAETMLKVLATADDLEAKALSLSHTHTHTERERERERCRALTGNSKSNHHHMSKLNKRRKIGRGQELMT